MFFGFTWDDDLIETSSILKISLLKLINSSKEIMMLRMFAYLILTSIDLYDFISPFSP